MMIGPALLAKLFLRKLPLHIFYVHISNFAGVIIGEPIRVTASSSFIHRLSFTDEGNAQ
jgi:hypothetical protein